MNNKMINWFDDEIKTAESVGPMGYATLSVLKNGKRILTKEIEKESGCADCKYSRLAIFKHPCKVCINGNGSNLKPHHNYFESK